MSWMIYTLLGVGIIILLTWIFFLTRRAEQPLKEGMVDYFNIEDYLKTLPTTAGRFVRVYPSPSRGDGYMTFTQIQVFDMNGNNVAKGKPVFATSTSSGVAPVSSTVDGTENPKGGAANVWTSGSTDRVNTYWEVDLGTTQQLAQIVYIGKLDANLAERNRARGMPVIVLDERRNVVISRNFISNDLTQIITFPNSINVSPSISDADVSPMNPRIVPLNSPQPEVFLLNTLAESSVAAEILCNTVGATLATSGQVSAAQKMGAEWCTPAWVKNSYALIDTSLYYPSQTTKAGCGTAGLNYVSAVNAGGTLKPSPATCFGIKPAQGVNANIAPFKAGGAWSQYVENTIPKYYGNDKITVPGLENVYLEVVSRLGTGSAYNSPPKAWADSWKDLSGSGLYATLIGSSPLNFLYEEGVIPTVTINEMNIDVKVFGSIPPIAPSDMSLSLDLCKRIFLGSPDDVDKFINIKYDDLKPYIRETNGYTKLCRCELVQKASGGMYTTVFSKDAETANGRNCAQSLTTEMLGFIPYPARKFIINWIYQRTARIMATKFGAPDNAKDTVAAAADATLKANMAKLEYMKATVTVFDHIGVAKNIPIPFDISNKYNLDQLAQAFYEGMGGNYTMSTIYDVFTIGKSVLDVRFDLTKHVDISALQLKIADLKATYNKVRTSNVSQDIIDAAKENYSNALADMQLEQSTNVYPPILGVVGRFFYTFDSVTGILDITGFTLDARAVTSFIPELNCGIQTAVGGDPGILNYTPKIVYTLNVSEPLQCSDPATLRRIMDDYTDASSADLADTLKNASPSVDTELGTLQVNEILGAVQISKRQCAIKWKETLWNDLSNAPVSAETTNIIRRGIFTYNVNQDDWYASDINMDASGFILYPSDSVPQCKFDTTKYKNSVSPRLDTSTASEIKNDFIYNTFNNGKGNPCPDLLPQYKFSAADYVDANTDLKKQFTINGVVDEVAAVNHYVTSGLAANRPVRAAQTIPAMSPTVVINTPLPLNNTLDNANMACPTTTCEDLNVLYILADGYNNDPTLPGTIMRITRAYTANKFQCDVEAEINYDTLVQDTTGKTVKKGSFTISSSGAQNANTKTLPSGIQKDTIAIITHMDLATCSLMYDSSDGPGTGTSILPNTPALYKPMEYATQFQSRNNASLDKSFNKVTSVAADAAASATSILSTYRTQTVAAVGNLATLGSCPTAKCSDTVNLNAMLDYYKTENQGNTQINTVLRVGTLDEKTCDLTVQEDTLSPGPKIASSQTTGIRFTMARGETPCNFYVTGMMPILPAPPPSEAMDMANKPNSATCSEVYGITGNFTQATAAAKCATYGGVLATHSQLQAAQVAGADWCSTGYVADMSGTAYYPTKTARAGCGTPGVNIHTPSTGIGANCYGVKPKSGRYTDVLPFVGSTWNQPYYTCGTFVNYVNPTKEAFSNYGPPIQVTESTYPLNSPAFGLARDRAAPNIDELYKEPLRQTGGGEESLPEKRASSYKYIRFRPTKTRYPMNPTVDVAKFRFFLGKNEVDITNAKVTNPMGSWVGDVGDVVGSGFTRGWSDVNKKALVFAFPYAVLLDGFTWTTANPDKGLGGDPVQWKLEGSQNGVYWTVLRDQTRHDYPVPKNRFQELAVFRF